MNSRVALRDPDASLSETLSTLAVRRPLTRRAMLRRLGGAGLLLTPLGSLAATCGVIPAETEGPYPGDGTNGPNALTQSGIVRSDVRSNFGPSGNALSTGIPLTVRLQVVNAANDCAPLGGYAVYIWHCDAQGRYSMYSTGVANQNFMRGVQVADNGGNVTFSTIFPGCYAGRWPHIHFEIYPSTAIATTGRSALRISQLALPASVSQNVYSAASALYPGSTTNLSRITLASDNVFSDGVSLQMADVVGSIDAGYIATLQIGVSAPTAVSNGVTVEYYNTDLDHYVMITDPAEIAAIDGGSAGPGWIRTGKSFEFEPATGSNSMPVYRFYGSVSPGPNSHFYTINEAEKAKLLELAGQTPDDRPRWNLEPAGGFWAGDVTPVGACAMTNGSPYYTVPIYRLYNNPSRVEDVNHRYTGSAEVAAAMAAEGWILEGVVFCAVRYN